MAELLELVPCLLCGESRTQVVASGSGAAQLVRCRNDGLVFLNPRPTPAALRDFHARFVRENNLELFDGYRREILRREAEAVKQRVAGGRLLDVGCATGTFFEFFPPDRWLLFGVDTSGLAVEHASGERRARVCQGTLEEAQFPPQFFDVVTILDTLYYAPDPMAELRESRRILKDDGWLAVEIPGLAYTLVRAMGPICRLIDGQPSPGLANSRHLYHFSANTIQRLLARCGFRVVERVPEQASLRGGRLRRMVNRLHFQMARTVDWATLGKISIAGKELYLARKAPASQAATVLAAFRDRAPKTRSERTVSAVPGSP
jgi:SAM-dependent methyltransferase